MCTYSHVHRHTEREKERERERDIEHTDVSKIIKTQRQTYRINVCVYLCADTYVSRSMPLCIYAFMYPCIYVIIYVRRVRAAVCVCVSMYLGAQGGV